jgi:hypothetical protein
MFQQALVNILISLLLAAASIALNPKRNFENLDWEKIIIIYSIFW